MALKLTELEVTRQISAPPEEVFSVWIDPKSPGGPWHSPTNKLIFNGVVDGLFYQEVKHEGRVWGHYGRFIRIEKPRYVEHTWVSEATKGVESLITVSFDGKDGGTLVTLRHTNVPDDEQGRGHKDGWAWVLDMLAGALASKK